MFLFVLALVIAPTIARGQTSPHLVLDLDNGHVLEAQNAFQPWHPASLTKMMTALVAFREIEAGRLAGNDIVTVTREATREPPSRSGYRAGTRLTLDDALKLLLVKSANDIAISIATRVSGSPEAFVARMNAEAARLGMTGSRFVNPHGLHDERQVVTARDIGLLILELHRNHQRYASFFRAPRVAAPIRNKKGKRVAGFFSSYNFLLERYRGADGFKTGYVCASGYNVAAAASRSGRRLGAIVLGETSVNSRTIRAARLLTEGFQRPNDFGTPLQALTPAPDARLALVNMREAICTKAGQEELRKAGPVPRLKDSPWLQPKATSTNVLQVTLLEPAPDVAVPKPRPKFLPPEPIDGHVRAEPGRIALPVYRPNNS